MNDASGFATAVTCIDGRVHEPLRAWVRSRFGVEHVDLVTEPGPELALGQGPSEEDTLVRSVRTSRAAHSSTVLVLAGHRDCAANPSGEQRQRDQVAKAAARLAERFPEAEVVSVLVGGCGARGCLEVSPVTGKYDRPSPLGPQFRGTDT